MSVLNKMLRDLEQRQASPITTTAVHHSISREDNRPLWLNLLLLLSAALLLFAIYAILTRPQPQAVVQQPTAEETDTAAVIVPAERLDSPPTSQPQQPIAEPEPVASPAQTQTEAEPVTQPPVRVLTPTVERQSEEDVASVEDRPATDIRKLSAEVLPAAQTAEPQGRKAEIAVQRAVPTTVQRAAAIQQRAVLAAQSGQLTEAITLWQQVQQLLPEQADAYIAQARLWQQLGLGSNVQHVLQQGIAQNAGSAELRLLLAQHYASSRQWQEADAVLTPQFELTQHPQYYGFKATVLQQLGDSSRAGYWFSQLILLQPEQARWWLGAAIAFDQSGQYQQAHIHYRQALQWGDSLSAESRNYIQQRLAATE